MNRYVLICFLCLLFGTECMFGKTYYELMMGSATGAINVSQSNYSDFEISDSYVSWSAAGVNYNAKYKRTNSNGDRIYQTPTNNFGMYTIVALSPNRKFMSLTVYWNGQWSVTRWLCDSKAMQQKFYAENKNIRSQGIHFETILDYNSSSSSSGSSVRKNRSSNCYLCHGTHIDPSPHTGVSITSFLKYYNSPRTKCPYCGEYSSHFHDKCTHCE